MIIYIYDKDNFSFIASKEAQPNPLSIGEYLMPENSTTIAPPNTLDGHIACFIDGEWVIKTDHRGHYQVKLDDVTFSIVDYIGDAQAGYQFISDEVYADYQEDNDKYKVVDGVFTDISDTEEYRQIKATKRETQFNKEFFGTTLGYVRRSVTMRDGSKKDFLSDLLPTISMGVSTGQQVKIITYDQPPFDEDVEDWTEYQNFVNVTPQFIQECFQQLSDDFLPINEEVE
mgnify:CR=1 FL=1